MGKYDNDNNDEDNKIVWTLLIVMGVAILALVVVMIVNMITGGVS